MSAAASPSPVRPPLDTLAVSAVRGGLTGEGDAAADQRQAVRGRDEGREVGRSGRSDRVRVLAQTTSSDVLFVMVEDRGPQPIAGLDRRFWRAFLEVNGRMTVLSALGFAGSDPQRGLDELAALASTIRGANPA